MSANKGIAIDTLNRIVSNRDGSGVSIETFNNEHRAAIEYELMRLGSRVSSWAINNTSIGDNSHLYPSDTIANPMLNSGYCFANDVFIARAYDWSDEPINLNFYHYKSKCDITWYKYYSRGTYAYGKETIELLDYQHTNEDWNIKEFQAIIDNCIDSIL